MVPSDRAASGPQFVPGLPHHASSQACISKTGRVSASDSAACRELLRALKQDVLDDLRAGAEGGALPEAFTRPHSGPMRLLTQARAAEPE